MTLLWQLFAVRNTQLDGLAVFLALGSPANRFWICSDLGRFRHGCEAIPVRFASQPSAHTLGMIPNHTCSRSWPSMPPGRASSTPPMDQHDHHNHPDDLYKFFARPLFNSGLACREHFLPKIHDSRARAFARQSCPSETPLPSALKKLLECQEPLGQRELKQSMRRHHTC